MEESYIYILSGASRTWKNPIYIYCLEHHVHGTHFMSKTHETLSPGGLGRG